MASTPSSVNSSLDSITMAANSPGGAFAGAGAGAKNVNFLSQLEQMMGAVKKEASALESMKAKLKDMEELKTKLADAKSRLTTAETENQQLRRMVKDSDDQNIEIRNDMQRLNDIYYAERGKVAETQQIIARLEQELSGIKLEKEFFAKEAGKVPELKSTLKTAKAQNAALKKSVDDDKIAMDQKIAECTKKCTSLEKLNEESGRHLYNVTEILNAAQTQVKELQDDAITAAEKLNVANLSRKQLQDRWLMSAEDLRLQIQRLPEATLVFEERLGALKAELQKVKLVASSKTNELFLLQSESKKAQAVLEQGSQAYSAQVSALQDNVRDLTNKNNEFVKLNASLKQKLTNKTTENEALLTDLSDVKQALKTQQLGAQQRDLESAQNIKSLSLQCEDAAFKIQSMSAQLETLQQQTKTEQGKHWEEVKQLKDSESLLLEECDRLNQELHDKSLQLHSLESESHAKESNMRNEVHSTSQMVGTLKEELERRLKDVMQLREERDALQAEKEELSSTLDALKSDLTKNDSLFKRTLEAERSKVKQEMQTRSARIRSLEAEKQELLSETQGLMAQVTESNREVTTLQGRYDELRHHKDTLSEQVDIVKAHNSQLMEDLKAGDREKEVMQAGIEQTAAHHNSVVERLEMMLRESKKSASQQVVEMSQQLKVLTADCDSLQREQERLQDAEKRALLDVDRVKNELNNAQLSHQETTHQLNNEINTLRRDLGDIRNKGKIAMESKVRVEMELINLRSEMGKMEMEAHKQNITLKESESSQKSLEESLVTVQAQLTTANESCTKLKGTIIDLEEGIQRKNSAIEGLKEDLVQLERDGLLEIRRLRLQLTSAENEISELRPMIPLLQKEASESKAIVLKLQNSQSGTVNGLLEEVRKAEERSASDRKKAAAEVEACHSRISELQAQLERTRELLEDSAARAKTDRTERELRVMQLEGEAERVRSAAAAKDSKIEELTQQHHADRVKMHELVDKSSNFDTELGNMKSALAHEQAKNQRLETRLRSLMSTPEFTAEGLSLGVNMPVGGGNGSSGFLSARGHSSSGHRNRSGNNLSNAAGNGGSNYGGNYGSNDAWDDDGNMNNTNNGNNGYQLSPDEASLMGHTVHTHASHASAHSHRSIDTHVANYASSGPLSGSDRNNPNRIAYHNSDSEPQYRAQSPFASNRFTGNDDVRSSRAEFPPQQAYNAERYSDKYGSGNGGIGGGNGGDSKFTDKYTDKYASSDRYVDTMRSPDRNASHMHLTPTKDTQRAPYSPRGQGDAYSTAQSRHAQSPVVDRVSAALAAKAAAESSKTNLKAAQQQRNTQQSRHHAAGHSGASGASVGTSNSAHATSGSATLNHSASDGNYNNLRRPPSASGLSTRDNTQNNSQQQQSHHQGVAGHGSHSNIDTDYDDYMSAASSALQYANNSTSNTSSSVSTQNQVSSAAEESIRRTQMMLNKRANNGNGANSGPSGGSANHNSASSGAREKTPTSGGRGVSKLTESIQQANHMYPPSPSNRGGDDRYRQQQQQQQDSSGDDYYGSADIGTPALKPMSPPSHHRSSRHDEQERGDQNSDDSGSDGEADGHSSLQRHSMASVAPYNNSGSGAGAGSSGGAGSKKVKKSSSGKHNSSGNKGSSYGGLEDALQLPKIAPMAASTTTSARRK